MGKYKSENIKAVEQLDRYFLINWHITGWCNFHCPYCINNEFSTKYTPEEKILEIADALNNYINNNLKDKRVSLRLIGGEPSFYDIPKILDRINHLDRVSIVTNFSRDNQFFKDMYEYCYKRGIFFFLMCSWHEEHPNFPEKIAELTKWCRETKERRMNFKVPQVSLIANSEFSQSTLDEYLKLGVDKIRIIILRDENQNHKPLTDEQLKIVWDWNNNYEEKHKKMFKEKNIKNKGFKITFSDGSVEHFIASSDLTNLIEDGGLDPTGFKCTSGITNMVVMPNADVIINKCDYWKDIKWGNLLKGDVKLPNEPLECPIIKSDVKTKCTLCSGVDLFRKE